MKIQPLPEYELLPLYIRVADSLRSQISAGELAHGSHLPGEHELCQAYGLSRGTIRRALAILAEEGWISRQPGRGTIVLPPRQRLPSRRQIAAVWNVISYFGGDMLVQLERIIAQAGYELVVFFVEHSPEREAEVLQRLAQSDMAGIVLYPTGTPANDPLVEAVAAKGIPLALLDRFTPRLTDRVSWVTSENEQGAYLVTQHLIQLGHRRIAHIIWAGYDYESINPVMERRAGYLRALKEAELAADPDLILSVTASSQLDNAETARPIFAFLDTEKPTAVFFSNDFIALRVYTFLREWQIRVPEDLSIAGFDHLCLPYVEHPLDLTSAAQDFTRLGVNVGNVILQLIENPQGPLQHVRVPVTLYVGSTTTRPRSIQTGRKEALRIT